MTDEHELANRHFALHKAIDFVLPSEDTFTYDEVVEIAECFYKFLSNFPDPKQPPEYNDIPF